MMELWRKLRGRLVEVLGRMSTSQRWSLGALVAVLLISLALLVSWSTSPGWVPLFNRDFEDAEMTDIIKLLREKQVEFRETGGQILVKPEHRGRITSTVYAEVAMSDDKDRYKYLYESRWDSTPSKDQKLFIREREKHLRDTIKNFEGIRSATVFINEQKSRVLFNKRFKSSASVNVMLKRGVAKPKSHIPRAIAYLLTGAVNNLKPSDVKITINGRFYPVRDDEANTLAGAPSWQHEIKQQVEKYYRDKASGAIEFLGGVLVQPEVEIDIARMKILKETRNVDDMVEDTDLEEITTTGGTIGAAEGMSSAVGTGGLRPAGSGSTVTKIKREKRTPILPSSVTENIDTVKQLVKKVSLSVIIPLETAVTKLHKPLNTSFDETNKAHWAALDKKMDVWKTCIAKATGADIKDISMTAEKFAVPMPKEPEIPLGEKFSRFFSEHWGEVVLVLLALGAIALITVNVKKTLPRVGIAGEAAMMPSAYTPEPEEEEEPEVEVPDIEDSEKDKQIAVMKERITEVADKEPEMVAGLLRTWLTSTD